MPVLWTEKSGMAQDVYAAQLEFLSSIFVSASRVHVLISLCLTTLPVSLSVVFLFRVFVFASKE